jgi:hypothetical protein
VYYNVAVFVSRTHSSSILRHPSLNLSPALARRVKPLRLTCSSKGSRWRATRSTLPYAWRVYQQSRADLLPSKFTNRAVDTMRLQARPLGADDGLAGTLEEGARHRASPARPDRRRYPETPSSAKATFASLQLCLYRKSKHYHFSGSIQNSSRLVN